MAIISKITQPGEGRVDSLGGNIALEEANNRLIVSDGTNRLALFGYDSDGEIVVKVAKPGFDADTATDEQLIFNSNQNIFKIVKTDTISVTLANTDPQQQVLASKAHGLSYTPGIIAFVQFTYGGTTTNVPMPYIETSNYNDVHSHQWMQVLTNASISVNSTDVTLNFRANYVNTFSLATSYTVKYYLLQESAA